MHPETHPLLAHAAGALLPYLLDPEVMEVRCTSTGATFLIRFGLGKERVPDVSPRTLDTFLAVVASEVGAEWRAACPRLHAADPALGFRIQASRPPSRLGCKWCCANTPAASFRWKILWPRGL
jgi:hypothetical protein